MMLKVDAIDAAYGRVQVLRSLSLEARAGEIHCLLGRNGAGKTTLMKAIMGLVPLTGGRILLDDAEISRLPAHAVPRAGGRKGSDTRARVLDLFPRLAERLDQRADTLSGGEQQMLATARALCLEPKLLLLDEPTEGLQPSMIALIREVVVEMKRRGVAIVLVEQRVDAVLSIADRVSFIENGRVALTTSPEALRADPDRRVIRFGPGRLACEMGEAPASDHLAQEMEEYRLLRGIERREGFLADRMGARKQALHQRPPLGREGDDGAAAVGLVVLRLHMAVLAQTIDDALYRGRVHGREAAEGILRKRARLMELGEGGELHRRELRDGAPVDRQMALVGAAQQMAHLIVKAIGGG